MKFPSTANSENWTEKFIVNLLFDRIVNTVAVKQSNYLEYTGTVRCSPGIQQIIFTSWNEPFATSGEA